MGVKDGNYIYTLYNIAIKKINISTLSSETIITGSFFNRGIATSRDKIFVAKSSNEINVYSKIDYSLLGVITVNGSIEDMQIGT